MRAAQTPWFGRPLAFYRSIPVAELVNVGAEIHRVQPGSREPIDDGELVALRALEVVGQLAETVGWSRTCSGERWVSLFSIRPRPRLAALRRWSPNDSYTNGLGPPRATGSDRGESGTAFPEWR